AGIPREAGEEAAPPSPAATARSATAEHLAAPETPTSSAANVVAATLVPGPFQEHAMRALFVGGTIDNSELDMDGEPPIHYPENSGGGQPRYRLYQVGRSIGDVAYAVYAAPGLPDGEAERIADERDYARRFSAEEVVRGVDAR